MGSKLGMDAPLGAEEIEGGKLGNEVPALGGVTDDTVGDIKLEGGGSFAAEREGIGGIFDSDIELTRGVVVGIVSSGNLLTTLLERLDLFGSVALQLSIAVLIAPAPHADIPSAPNAFAAEPIGLFLASHAAPPAAPAPIKAYPGLVAAFFISFIQP
ncbi:MAG: hypothetical protein H6909_02350 [Rickettsiaceae bacterium]|nr:hypothetical protein [Rickettsiaceae bacterium]